MPHLSEECWHQMGNTNSIIDTKWPQFEDDLLIDDECIIIIQINGKKRAEIKMPSNSTENAVFENVMKLINIKNYIKENSLIKKKIFIPNKILNIVI
jgi:leucyl-tRNA synthetase